LLYQETKAKTATTCKRRLDKHIPTLGLKDCKLLTVHEEQSAPETPVQGAPPARESTSEKKKSQAESQAALMAKLSNEVAAHGAKPVTSKKVVNFSAEDVEELMKLVYADVGHEGRFGLACFLKSQCTHMFPDSGRQLWLDMTQRFKKSAHHHDLGECEHDWDRLNARANCSYTFRTLLWQVRKFDKKAANEWQARQVAELHPGDVTPYHL
jgi:hypothetical protein